ncbi:MAG: hypothetical protein WC139_12820 [Candidatus Kapaibacterium sp.]
MAKLNDQHLGTLRGALGPQVFKMLFGEAYVARLPRRTMNEPSAETIERRNRFKMCMKFSKSLYGLRSLRPFWDAFIPEGVTKRIPTIAKIAKVSYQSITTTAILDETFLAPDFGFSVTTTDLTIDGTEINVAIDPLGLNQGFDLAVEKFIQLDCVMHLSDPVNGTLVSNRFMNFVSANVVLNLANPLSFNIPLDPTRQSIYSAYETHKTFMILTTSDANGKSVHFSNTFVS